ncbi:hypothetical protein [Nocardioides speluncae]|uniref:hypothetical protein n=1 Tax=Nocardioides speluncae TaxID=2670337 RepID=UPI000D68FD4A|nr:hypothetical protein [Nocardioides speluncae]
MTEQLRTRLRDAADGHTSGIQVPDLLHRAQVSKRRHRYAAGGATVLAAAVLVGGAMGARAALPENPDDTAPASPQPRAEESKWVVMDSANEKRVNDANIGVVRRIIDADNQYVVGKPSASCCGGGSESGEIGASLYFVWQHPGVPQSADPHARPIVQVSIANGWGGTLAECGSKPDDGNQCREVELPGGVVAKMIGTKGDDEHASYAYKQPDGTVIQLSMGMQYGGDAPKFRPDWDTEATYDWGISDRQIAAVLTAEELDPPLKQVRVVPGMSATDAKRALLQALGDDAATYRHKSGTDDDGTKLEGTFAGGGTLSVDLDEMTADLVPADGCQPDEPAVCEERTVDGQTVTTWSVLNQDPGNFQLVLVEGEQRRVYLSYYLPAGGQGALTLDELAQIAADAGWQR